MFDMQGLMRMGSRIEVVRGLIPKGDEPQTLTPGYRAASHGENQPYYSVAVGETADAAFTALKENIRSRRNPFEINHERDKGQWEVINVSDPGWSLSVYTPRMGEPRATYDGGDPQHFAGSFHLVKSALGNCLKMTFQCANGLLPVPFEARDILSLSLNDEPRFYGLLTRFYPTALEPKPNEVISTRNNVDGWLLMDPVNERMSVHQLIAYLAERYFDGQVAYNPDKIQIDQDWQVEGLDLQTVKLSSVFDELVLNIPRSEWGVDAAGEFYIKRRM